MAFVTASEAQPIRLLLVDDHQVFADSLGLALDRHDDLEVVAAVQTPWDAREALNSAIDVALVDVELGEHDGLTLAKEITVHFPATKVVVLTAFSDPDTLQQALDIGVNGFILKSVPLAELVSTVRSASMGQVVVPAPLLSAVVDRRRDLERKQAEADTLRGHLSKREIEMLELLAAGHSTNEIAAELFLSINTVRTHIQNVLTKLDAHSRLEAVSIAIQSGLIEPPTATTG